MSFGARLRQERLRRHLSQEALAEALGISPRSIRRWEKEEAIPQATVRLQLSRFFGLRPEDLFGHAEVQEPSTLLWNVPYPRNPYFTGRDAILHTLHTRLNVAQPVVLTQSSAVTGLGGIGKTQVAIEYAYRYRQEYSAVFWLGAETIESLMNSLQHIADLLQLPQRQQPEQAQMVKAVKHWLNTHAGWLLIADNVEELDLLQAVLPPLGEGAMLLTTRQQALGILAEPLELSTMNEEEGTVLLLRRAKRLQVSTHVTLPLLDAEELVTLLGGLPLALDQAAAYIEETGCSIADYLQRYQNQRPLVLARRGLHGGAHPTSVTTTLQVSVERVGREHPAAIDLLRACAFLHPDAIPEDLLIAGASHLGPNLQQAVADAYQFDLMLSALRGASLIARYPETHTLSMHRLVQAVLQDQMEPVEVQLWRERMVRVVATSFPAPDFASWLQCERLLQSVLACVQWLETAGSNLPEAGELLLRAGNYLMKRGRFAEAEPILDRAIGLTEQCYGPDHAALIPLLLVQSELFHYQGKYGPGESLLRRTLALCEQHLGPTHIRTAETINNLALTYHEQGEYEQAEPLFLRALRIQEQQSQVEITEVANTLNNLALLYRDQEKFGQAEELLQRALHIREQQLGSEHPDTAVALNNLAIVYRRQEKYEQAEPFYLRALHILNQQLGPEHPYTAAIINNLANVYRDQGKYEQAEPLYQQALHIRERQLGPEHPDTARTLANMATLYREQEQYEQAERLYQWALSLQECVLGAHHPEIAKTLQDFAVLQETQGKLQEAASLYQRALAIREATLGAQR